MHEMESSNYAQSISGIEIGVQDEEGKTSGGLVSSEQTTASRMTEIPAYLLGRPRRLHQAEHNAELTLANENSGGGSTEDGDFKQLRKIREKRRQEREQEKTENLEIQPELIMAEVRHNIKSYKSNGPRPVSASRQKKFEDLRKKMFKSVKEDDIDALDSCLREINMQIPFSDAVMTNPKNNQNVLNCALSKKLFEKASLIIDKGDETLLQNAFSVGSTTKTALLQVTETNQIDLAKKILSRLKDAKKAMTANTKIEMTDQRPREFSCLHLAAYHGYTELVKFYLEYGAKYGISVDFPNKKQDTALLWATKCGHIDTVTFLLEKGADPNKGNDKGSTAFYWAIRYEHTEIVKLLLNSNHKKVDIHKERKLGLVAPIALASAYGNRAIVELLLKHGANKNHVIPGSQTPLHLACKEGHVKVVLELLKYKADFRMQDDKGDCAILLAARYGHADIVRILLDLEDDPARRNNLGHDTWYYAINSKDLSLLKVLMEYGSRLSSELQISRDPLGRPHFFTAAGHGHIEKIKYLFKSGHNPDDRDSDGNTFLHHAASFNQSEVIKTFHKYIPVDTQNDKGETCLHISVNAGFVPCTQALLEVNASTNVPNTRGENILHIAAMSKHTTQEVAKMLVDHTVKTHDWESLNAVDKFGNNALHIAAKFAKPDVLWEFRYLRFKDLDEDGNTPLHEAVRKGEDSEGLETMLDIFEVMDRDGNINEPNNNKETVLHLAALEGYHNTIRRLCYLRANLDAQDKEGNTVLHKLINAMANDPVHCNRYLKSYETIVDESTHWWMRKKSYKVSDAGQISKTRFKRQAMVYLMTSLKNNMNFSPFTLACKLGIHEILSRYLMTENITLFHEGDNVLFDVTNVMPMTAQDLTQKYFSIPSAGKIKSELSGLEILMRGTNKERATRILDIPPMKEVEKIYNVLNALTFTVLTILHIVYMSLFSYAGLELSKEFRENPINITTDNSVYILAYIVVPMEPLIFLLYFLLTVIATCKSGDFSRPLSRVLPFLFYLTFSCLVITWLVLITTQERYQDYILAICLGLGWIYTINFTRGFKAINYFWRMILNMIVSDVRRFLIVYACVLLAFAFALHAIFQISSSIASTYPTMADTIFLVFNVMVGMGEIFDDNFETGMSDAGRTTGFAKVVYVIYLVLATIVLLNMLIAMMNDSYSQTLAVQKYHWRVDSVQIGVSIERLLPWLPKMFSKIKHQSIPGEDENYDVKKYYIVLTEEQFEEKYGHMFDNEDEQNKDQLRENFVKVNARMDETDQQLSTIRNRLEELVSLVEQKSQ